MGLFGNENKSQVKKLKKIADSYNGMIILDNKVADGQMLVCFEVRI